MLQFQSLGTLAAAPGLLASMTLGWNISPFPTGCPKPTGPALVGISEAADAVEVDDARLPARDFHDWNSAWQWSHEREGVPRGL